MAFCQTPCLLASEKVRGSTVGKEDKEETKGEGKVVSKEKGCLGLEMPCLDLVTIGWEEQVCKGRTAWSEQEEAGIETSVEESKTWRKKQKH